MVTCFRSLRHDSIDIYSSLQISDSSILAGFGPVAIARTGSNVWEELQIVDKKMKPKAGHLVPFARKEKSGVYRNMAEAFQDY